MNERFGVGKVLGTGFRVWGTNLVPFVLITMLVYIPVIIWTIALIQHPTMQGAINYDRYAQPLESMLNIIASAALTYGVVKELQGQRASIGSCIGTGLARFFPVLGVGLMTVLCVFGATLALVIPGLIVACMLYVATPAAVIERPGVMGALKRSRTLTENHRLEIFGLLVILVLIAVGGQQLVKNVARGGAGLTTTLVTLVGVQILVGSLSAVMNAVAYYYLRQEKEGTSAAELAKVFE